MLHGVAWPADENQVVWVIGATLGAFEDMVNDQIPFGQVAEHKLAPAQLAGIATLTHQPTV
jgi:hypothetical protein